MVSRRQVVAGLSVAGTIALSGCAGTLTSSTVECNVVQVIDGGACEIEVENNAYPGDLRVILETRDADETIVGTTSEIVDVGIGDTRRVNMNPELHSDMDHVTASVEGA